MPKVTGASSSKRSIKSGDGRATGVRGQCLLPLVWAPKLLGSAAAAAAVSNRVKVNCANVPKRDGSCVQKCQREAQRQRMLQIV